MCNVCNNLLFKRGFKSKYVIEDRLLDGDNVNCKMEIVLDDNNGKPDLFIHAQWFDENGYFNNMVFKDLHFCPKCGRKIT